MRSSHHRRWRRRPYLLRGLVRCGICQRKMQGASICKDVYYRCIARTLAPGAAALADHPRTVNLREDHLLEPLNGWIGRLVRPEQRGPDGHRTCGIPRRWWGSGRVRSC
ncbi:hypothetical protein BLA60_14910 [Actinophytocola xinjiangensis]|uniref:Recombinase zinc beta ribbon domain-containing protein n=1 Tax=Actinophytocola xinjiangensis TaxID=485602 RepID=A0A7Z0WNL0_9PSEU|nr:hypothetical protein BLA60_14910 [Actinophytocola xinjiangensis]